MALSTKTVAEFQLDYSEVGSAKIEAGLREKIKLLQRMTAAYTMLRNAAAGAAISESQVKGANTVLNTYPKKLAFLERELAVQRQLNQVKGDVTRATNLPTKEQVASAGEINAINTHTEQMRRSSIMAQQADASERMAIINRTESENRAKEVIRQKALTKQLRAQEQTAAWMAKDYGGTREQIDNSARRDAQRKQQMVNRVIGTEQANIVAGLNPEQLVEYHLNKWRQTFRRVADALASFIIVNTLARVFTGFFQSIISSNAVMENLDTRLRIMAGPNGGVAQLKAEIIRLTVNTPFIVRDFADAAVSLTAFGQNAKKNLEPIANWAAAIGKDLPDVALAFSKIATGSPRSALLLSTRGINKAEFDAELKKTGDRAEALRNLIARKFGDMAFEVSKTFEGLVSNVKDAWLLLSVVIGKPLFENIKKDVNELFKILQAPGTIAAGNILGIVLNNLYNVIKVLLVPALIILTSWLGVKLKAGFLGIMDTIALGVPKFAQMIPALNYLTMAFAAFAFVYFDVTNTVDGFYAAQTNVNKTLNEFGLGSQVYIDALQQMLEKTQALQSQTVWYSAVLADLFNFTTAFNLLKAPLSGKAWDDFFNGNMWGNVDTWQKAINSIDKQKKYIEEQKKLKAQLDAIWASKPGELEGKTVFDLKGMAEGLNGGKELLTQWLQYIKDKLSDFATVWDSKTGTFKQVRLTGQLPGSPLSEINSEGRGILLDMQKTIQTVLTGTEKDIQKLTFDQALKEAEQLTDVVAKLGKSGLGGKALDDALKQPLESLNAFKKALVETSLNFDDLIAQISGLKAQEKELLEGEPKLWAVGQRNLDSYLTWKQKVDQLETKKANTPVGKQTPKQQRELLEATLNMWKAEVGFLITGKTLTDQKTDALIRQNEVTADLLKKEAELAETRVDYEYTVTADVNSLYKNRYDQLKTNQSKTIDNENKIAEITKTIAEMHDDSGVEFIKETTKLLQFDMNRLDLANERYNILKKIDALPSDTLGTGWDKTIKNARIELNKFNDTLADTIYTATRTFAFDTIKSLLFGDNTTDNSQQIADAQLAFQQTKEEEARAYKNATVIQRKADETNEAYLQRAQIASQMNGLAIEEYTFKTKELEQLEKINQLEGERNNLILQRLQALGEKVFDKLLDYAIGAGMDWLFKKTPDTPGKPASSTGNDFGGKSQSGGVNFHVYGNVYGEKDFANMVDGAMQKLNARRSA